MTSSTSPTPLHHRQNHHLSIIVVIITIITITTIVIIVIVINVIIMYLYTHWTSRVDAAGRHAYLSTKPKPAKKLV
jgi:hypothetical protein